MDERVLDSPSSSRAYDADVSISESYGSVAFSEALPNELDILPHSPVAHVRPPMSSSVQQRVELIRAQSRIVELESALSVSRQTVKRARIEEVDHVTSHVTLSKDELERLHKLEQERCKLLEDLGRKKSQLEAAEKEMKEFRNKHESMLQIKDREMRELRGQIAELEAGLNSSESRRERLELKLSTLKLNQASLAVQELNELTAQYSRTIETLSARVQMMGRLEAQLQSSEAHVKELERQLETLRSDRRQADTLSGRLLRGQQLEEKMASLSEENAVLTQNRDNTHLLRYKVSELTERCERVQGLEESVARLELENSELRVQLETASAEGTGGGTSLALLQYRVAQLQNSEKAWVHKRGVLEARVNAAEAEVGVVSKTLGEVKGQLSKAQQDLQIKDDKIQRLEKRMLFVSKEREGCINVLNSYSCDAGVDGILRQTVTELKSQLKRADERIAELENVLETKSMETVSV